MSGLIVDLFAGAGGASLGIEAALGRHVDLAVNHDPVAIAVHSANHPQTTHHTCDVFEVDPLEATQGKKVDALWGSPDCTHFSVAKGGKPRSQNVRSLAWVIVDWARKVRPSVIFLENVQEFQTWGPLGEDNKPDKKRAGETFAEWIAALRGLGYVVEWRTLIASHFGAPTSRKRLFLVARCDGKAIVWPTPTHGPGLLPFRSAAECIDWTIKAPSIFDRAGPLADATLRRIASGIKRFVIDAENPFVVGDAAHTMVQTSYGERKGQAPRILDICKPLGTIVAQGTKHALVSAFLAKHYGGVVGVPLDGRPLDTITTKDHHSLVTAFLTSYYGSPADVGQFVSEPLRTVTTKDRFGLVTVKGQQYAIEDIGMRMLEPHELLAAQFGTFAENYDLSAASNKTDKVRLIGNSVCPEVARALVEMNLEREDR